MKVKTWKISPFSQNKTHMQHVTEQTLERIQSKEKVQIWLTNVILYTNIKQLLLQKKVKLNDKDSYKIYLT